MSKIIIEQVKIELTEQACSVVCEPDTCDTFQFMSKTLKMKILHPGGLKATKLLAEKCNLSSGKTILDAGCGSGLCAIYLAKRYGCRIVGIDIELEPLLKAQAKAISKGLGDQVTFRVADMNNLPFENQTFDGAIFQASLIFTDKTKALSAVNQKIRPGGFIGLIELAWKKPPIQEIVTKVRKTLCSAAVNTEIHENWMRLLTQTGFEIIYSELRDHKLDFSEIMRNEGLISSLRIARRSIINKATKRKMKQIASLFKETHEYLGYGIYVARKTQLDRSPLECPNPRTLGNTDHGKI